MSEGDNEQTQNAGRTATAVSGSGESTVPSGGGAGLGRSDHGAAGGAKPKRTLRQRRGKPRRTVRNAFYSTADEKRAIEDYIIENTELNSFTDFCRICVMSVVEGKLKLDDDDQ